MLNTIAANHELNPVLTSISDGNLEANISKALSLTSHDINPGDLQACHRIKKGDLLLLNVNVENRNEDS